jgi:uncharacterized protein (DUF58 family)
MKIKELIVMLESMDETLDVICMTRDADFLKKNQSYRVLEINSVDLAKTKLLVPAKALPTVKLKQSSIKTNDKQVVIEMSANDSPRTEYTYERRTGIDRRTAKRDANFSYSQRAS